MTTRYKKPLGSAMTREDAEQIVREIAELENQSRQLKATQDEELMAIREQHGPDLEEIHNRLQERVALAQSWAESDREAKFGKRKSLKFRHGNIGFRKATPSLKLLKGWSWKKVLDAIRRAGYAYIREVPEVDKELLLNNRSAFTDAQMRKLGVEVKQDETFFVKPDLSSLEDTKEVA